MTLGVLLVILGNHVALGASLTPQEERLVRAALEGGELEKYELYNHKWNMRKVGSIGFEDGTFIVKGHFKHYKKLTLDDTVEYDIQIKDGKVVDDPNMIQFDHAFDWRYALLNYVKDYLEKKFGEKIPDGLTKETLAEFQKSLADMKNDGPEEKWEEAAAKVVRLIALSGFERMQTVTAYTDTNHRGQRQMFAAGAYNAREFTKVGNDRISSLFIPKGLSVKVCQHDNGVGPCQTFTGGRTINLPAPLDNSVSYVEVSRLGRASPISQMR
jgi:hypothetical protein